MKLRPGFKSFLLSIAYIFMSTLRPATVVSVTQRRLFLKTITYHGRSNCENFLVLSSTTPLHLVRSILAHLQHRCVRSKYYSTMSVGIHPQLYSAMLVPDIHVLPIYVFIYGLLLYKEKNLSSVYQYLSTTKYAVGLSINYLICYMEPRLRLKRKGT